jgi:hypothetical protein
VEGGVRWEGNARGAGDNEDRRRREAAVAKRIGRGEWRRCEGIG